MKIILFLLINLFINDSSDLKKIRTHYKTISKTEDTVNNLKSILEKSTTVSTPLKTAYYAAIEMASAKYKFNPAAKLATFNSGKKKLEAIINTHSTDIEMRYIRLSIQNNAPSFLGYTKDIKADKTYLINNLSKIKLTDPDLYSNVYGFLLSSFTISDSEKKIINS